MPSALIRYQNPLSPLSHRLLLGIGIVALASLAWLDHLRVSSLPLLDTFWPLALVVLGLGRLAWPRQAGGVFGLLLITTGGLLTARNLGWLDPSPAYLWPALVVGAGLCKLLYDLVLQRTGGNPFATRVVASRVSLNARFSNLSQRCVTQHFEGGEIALHGSNLALDLRQAAIQGREAVLDISARFSSIELQVPPSWEVVMDLRTTLGRVSQSVTASAAAGPRLVLRGQCVFGGVEIRH
jgi:Domain of unknown function (DUF5668)